MRWVRKSTALSSLVLVNVGKGPRVMHQTVLDWRQPLVGLGSIRGVHGLPQCHVQIQCSVAAKSACTITFVQSMWEEPKE